MQENADFINVVRITASGAKIRFRSGRQRGARTGDEVCKYADAVALWDGRVLYLRENRWSHAQILEIYARLATQYHMVIHRWVKV
jgi:hypothetical protein